MSTQTLKNIIVAKDRLIKILQEEQDKLIKGIDTINNACVEKIRKLQAELKEAEQRRDMLNKVIGDLNARIGELNLALKGRE